MNPTGFAFVDLVTLSQGQLARGTDGRLLNRLTHNITFMCYLYGSKEKLTLLFLLLLISHLSAIANARSNHGEVH